ncbi:MAG: Lrp/AsnC family transcriptional regulator [Thermoplasmatota archaeon]
MPKSSKEKIEADEKKILAVLGKNSNENIDSIAKKCGFSRQKVWRIIKRLENNKTIWGYHAVVDNEKIKKKSFIMLLKRSQQPLGESISKIIKTSTAEIGKKVGVTVHYNAYLHGIYDWMFCFSADDIRQAKKFSELLTYEFSEFIREIHLLEEIFPLKKDQIINPNITKFKEYF